MKKPKKEKKVNPDNAIAIKFLQDYYDIEYKKLFEIPANISWGRDAKFIAKLLKTYSDISEYGCENKYEFLVKICEKFFLSKDTFVIKKLWDLHSFYLLFPKLVLQLKNQDTGILDGVREGYKLAYWNYNECQIDVVPESYDEIFSQIYIFIKPYFIEYGAGFSLKRFAEIYFLIIMECLGSGAHINLYSGKFAQDKFIKWIDNNKSDLKFYPKDIGTVSKEKLDLELQKSIIEELSLLK